MIETLDSIKNSIVERVWGKPLTSMPTAQRCVIKSVRILYMLFRELSQGTLTLRAASLVFTTLLSLVPLLAVSFSLLKAFGVHARFEGVLHSLLEPLGEQGVEIATRLLQFVEQMKVGVLGGVGVLLLFVTVISLVRKVESALNTTWRVQASHQFVQRISGYLSVLLVGPVLVFAALGLIGTLMSTAMVQGLATIEPFGTVLAFVPRFLPYIFIIVAFTTIYLFMPNAQVRVRSALLGGVVAGVLWASASWGFASFVVNSPSSNYTAVYSSFAIVFVFMLWMYIAWLILLIGGTVAFYYQMPEYLGVMPGELRASNRLRERIALAAMVRIGRQYLHGGEPVLAHILARQMQLPLGLIQRALQSLQDEGFVALVAQPHAGYVPARDIANISLLELLVATRSANDHKDLAPDNLPAEPAAELLMQALEASAAQTLGVRTLRDLVLEEEQSDVRIVSVPPSDSDQGSDLPDTLRDSSGG